MTSYYLEFNIQHYSDSHVEITSLPVDEYLYQTKITLESITIPSRELESCTHVSVTWYTPERINIQAFRVDKSTIAQDYTTLNIKEGISPTVYIDYMQIKDIFLKVPQIKASVLMGRDLYYFNDIKEGSLKFHCQGCLNVLDKLFYNFPMYIETLIDMFKEE